MLSTGQAVWRVELWARTAQGSVDSRPVRTHSSPEGPTSCPSRSRSSSAATWSPSPARATSRSRPGNEILRRLKTSESSRRACLRRGRRVLKIRLCDRPRHPPDRTPCQGRRLAGEADPYGQTAETRRRRAAHPGRGPGPARGPLRGPPGTVRAPRPTSGVPVSARPVRLQQAPPRARCR